MYNTLYTFQFLYICIRLTSTDVSKLSSTEMVNCLPQRQQDNLVVSQPSSLVSIVSDTHITTNPVTTLNVVECLTTSSSVVTSISGQHVSTITTTAGWFYCNVATRINADSYYKGKDNMEKIILTSLCKCVFT